MTSPPTRITVDCSRCGAEYEAWDRPSINLELDDFDDAEIEEASTARCPDCGATVNLDPFIVEGRPTAGMQGRQEAVAEAMSMLLDAERARHEAISELKDLGAIRSRSIVGELGEEMAAAYYGAARAPGSNPRNGFT